MNAKVTLCQDRLLKKSGRRYVIWRKDNAMLIEWNIGHLYKSWLIWHSYSFLASFHFLTPIFFPSLSSLTFFIFFYPSILRLLIVYGSCRLKKDHKMKPSWMTLGPSLLALNCTSILVLLLQLARELSFCHMLGHYFFPVDHLDAVSDDEKNGI